MDTESLAVSAVNTAIGAADYLKSYINQGEKGPSLDGYICVYSEKGYKKANETGRAHVQVKGKEAIAAEFLQERVSYQVELSDLLAFRREGGAIFFVVLIEKENPGHTRIYYNPLLPYDLNEIINGKENQGSIMIHLKPFPSGKEMEDAVLTFANNRIKQFGIVDRGYHNYSLEEIIGKPGVTAPFSFKIGYTTIQKNENKRPFGYLFSHDFYIYYLSDPFGSMIPMQHVSHMEMVSTVVPCSLKIGNEEFFNICHIYYLKDKTVYGFKKQDNSAQSGKLETTVSIQDANSDGREVKPIRTPASETIKNEKFTFFAVVYEEEDELGRHKVTYTYNVTGSLKDRINIEAFLIALNREGTFSLNGRDSSWHPSEDELKSIDFDTIRENYEFQSKVQKALDMVGCQEELSCDAISEKDDLRLRCMTASLLEGVTIGFEGDIPEIVVYDVANLHLLLFFDKQKDGKYIIRPIPEAVECHTEDDEGIHPTSFYTILNDKEYARLSNLDMNKVVVSICSFDDKVHYERANGSVLLMLMAYDKCGKSELLDAAEKISKWLVKRRDINTDVYKMNLYQCLKRKGKLTEKQRRDIRKISRETESIEFQAGCYLLLDQQEKAAECIDKLPAEKKEAFLTYPIMKFMDSRLDGVKEGVGA